MTPSPGHIMRLARYRQVPWRAAPDDVVVGYVGWTGEGNLGDEAMYLCHQYAYPDNVRFVPMPILGSNAVLDRYAAKRLDALCLGGGTLIGNGHFRLGIETLQRARPDIPNFMLGVGCEDHRYREGNRASILDELNHWPAVLSRFDSVRLRGPLSLESVETMGVDAEVSADPAMLLPTFSVSVRSGRVGINLGVVDDSWGDSGGSLEQLAGDLVRLLHGLGKEVVLLPTTDEDLAFCASSPSLQGLETSTAAVSGDVLRFARDSAACELVIGMKLHAVVIATTQFIPTISLEYRPKCRDFMLTIGREDRVMRTDAVDMEQLAAWIDEDLHDRDAIRQELEVAVNAQRVRLLACAERDSVLLGA